MNPTPPFVLRGQEVRGFRGYMAQNVPVVTPGFPGMHFGFAWKQPDRLVTRLYPAGVSFSAALPVLRAEPYPLEKAMILMQALDTARGTKTVSNELLARTLEIPGTALYLQELPDVPDAAFLGLLRTEILPYLAKADGIHASAHPYGVGTNAGLLVLVENFGDIVAEDDPRIAH